MNAGRTARARARAELTREIKDEARRQLRTAGAGGLSLRAVARELGMVSSALYRYFPSRDELLTELIVDAYNAIGDAAERADAGLPRDRVLARWLACCHALRAWAIEQPHEYALIYGSPVPGYQAPQDTVAAAARVPLVMIGILADAHTAGELKVVHRELTPVLARQATQLSATLREALSAHRVLPPVVLVNAIIAWTQVFGMLSFELFGQLVGSVDPSAEFFAEAARRMAEVVGLPGE